MKKALLLLIFVILALFLIVSCTSPSGSSGSNSSNSTGSSTPNLIYVANNIDSTVTYFNAKTGANLGTFTTGTTPYKVAVNPSANILYVTNYGSATVTYFNAMTGDYLFGVDGTHPHGTLIASSFTTGSLPEGVAVNPSANILYVTNYGSATVTYFNAMTGDYLFGVDGTHPHGTLAASSFTTGSSPYGVAVNPSASTAGILYVANLNSNTVTYFNAKTGVFINGGTGPANLAASSFSTGAGSNPNEVAVNPSANILYVTNGGTNTVTYFNATTGSPFLGSLAASSISTGTGSCPFGVAVNPSANILYVANYGISTVTYLNATTGDYLFGVDGTHPHGTLAASSFTTGSAPYGAAINLSANILYVTNASSATVTYFNATTGDYLFGSPAHDLTDSSFTTGNTPYGVAVNP